MDNNKILYRIEIIEKCINGRITENKASKLLNISIRQVQRLIKKYKENGKISLFHGLTNKESNHRINKNIKNEVLELIKTKYYDFGATLLNECLERYENKKLIEKH
ncbi:MAG TPA: helix-turn-helix domain-containing protein [Rickettsiales bacterium]|nr:helix-turn-helix domain-containing protein [Rickettsiales bacterium]